MAADLFVVPTVTFRLLFVLVILGHERRRIVHVAVTDASHRGVDRTAAAQRVSGERRPCLPAARPRRRLYRRRDDHRGHEHRGSSHRASLAVAERLRGTRHRVYPT